jgi:hypothetical protein
MSLSVSAYKRNSENELEWLTPAEPFNDLAGFESTRKNFWASEEVRNLGLTLLPTLKERDIWAEGVELIQLESEINILAHALPALNSSYGYEYLQFRLSNIKEAIRLAKESLGGVNIG